MIEKNKHNEIVSETELIKQIQRLQQSISIYEELAEKIRNAAVIDNSIYLGEYDQDWLSIHREDYAQMWPFLQNWIYGGLGIKPSNPELRIKEDCHKGDLPTPLM